jgi:Tfp pilus assembly protein PilF
MRQVNLIFVVCGMITGCQHLEEGSVDQNHPAAPAVTQHNADNAPSDITAEGKTSVRLALARLHEQNGQTERAIHVYGEVLNQSPKCVHAMWRLAVLHDLSDAFEKSEPHYLTALELDPDNANLHCDYGYSLYLQNRWTEAESQLRHSVRLRPDHGHARTNLGLVLARTGRSEEALGEFRKAGCTPSQAHANVAYSDCLRGELQRALEHYETALQFDPQSDTAKSGQREVVHMLTEASVASVDQ